MQLLLLEEMVMESNSINSLVLKEFILMMIIKVSILLIIGIIVLLNGNVMESMVKLLQV
jgi:hypothetical protein